MGKHKSWRVLEKPARPAGKLAQWATQEAFYGRLRKPARVRVWLRAAQLWLQEAGRTLAGG